jgi:hypothetical protein
MPPLLPPLLSLILPLFLEISDAYFAAITPLRDIFAADTPPFSLCDIIFRCFVFSPPPPIFAADFRRCRFSLIFSAAARHYAPRDAMARRDAATPVYGAASCRD